MKVLRIVLHSLLRLLPFALIAAVCVAAFLPPPEAEERRPCVVRIWSVDTFEGGKGSRSAFLKRIAREAEKGAEGVFYLVSDYTPAGALAAFEEGDAPDLISFGIGLPVFAERALPLSYAFSGGELNKETVAVPWCRGGYALFCLDNDFGKAGKTAISCGGSNLPAVAAALGGISGEELPSQEAYTRFLGGEYRYLLGTQRDLCRFRARGTEVCVSPLGEFCDLYQYISLLSSAHRAEAERFLSVLLSEETEKRLGEIGMEAPFKPETFAIAKRTASVFASDEARAEMRRAALAGDGKTLEKFLKNI